jgi:hypothetical protein
MILYSIMVKSGYKEKFDNMVKNLNILVGDDAVKIIDAKDIVAIPKKEGGND